MIPNEIIDEDAELFFSFRLIQIRAPTIHILIDDIMSILKPEKIYGIFVRPARKWEVINNLKKIQEYIRSKKDEITLLSIICEWNHRIVSIYLSGLRTSQYSIQIRAYNDCWSLDTLTLDDKKAFNRLLRVLDEKLLPQRKGFECEVPDVSPYIGKTGFLLFEE